VTPTAAPGPVTNEEAQAMLRAVVALFERWGLLPEEKRVLLGAPSEHTYQRWLTGESGPLPDDTIFRLADLLGIHNALRHMFADVERAYAWVRRPNEAFGGKSALEIMLPGARSDIIRVRTYLDTERL
jgi:hypothetical protein